MVSAPPDRSLALARRRAHAWVGGLGVAAFLASGLWMHFRHDHLAGFDRATRLAFRSIHIDLLFAALLNVAVAAAVRPLARAWTVCVAWLGSLSLLAAPPLLAVAFMREPLAEDLERPLTRLGIVTAAAGFPLLAVARWRAGGAAPPRSRGT